MMRNVITVKRIARENDIEPETVRQNVKLILEMLKDE